MNSKKPKILIVDDEEFNLDLLEEDLKDNAFDVVRAEDGLIALAKLKANPDIEVIVLDRMMPNMDGMQVVHALKSDERFEHIPIIMQTAAGQSQQIKEGVAAGVFYYLIKPYAGSLLISIVKNALNRDVGAKGELASSDGSSGRLRELLESGSFRFRTLNDVNVLAQFVAGFCPKPDHILYGLRELMVNAVEHGNLNITYVEKLELVLEDCWKQEVERRLALPEHINKFATLTFEANAGELRISIKDQGKGFKWQDYIDFDPMRMASDPHGKGIAIAKVTSFPYIEYREGGTKVVCRMPLE